MSLVFLGVTAMSLLYPWPPSFWKKEDWAWRKSFIPGVGNFLIGNDEAAYPKFWTSLETASSFPAHDRRRSASLVWIARLAGGLPFKKSYKNSPEGFIIGTGILNRMQALCKKKGWQREDGCKWVEKEQKFLGQFPW